ncbi:glutaredoxin family protein [Parasulfuritortus cantonensis]|uniref:Glutaredoxin family protein n=1 Tax=Parasulfuritortus cantonensis TaxID=2528202 RepID=A0A4R1B7Z1_9PROT|nr:glutaredoxin family protein [Parasulfuritortus cantonensis]TCJ11929.1 glutaredoxin family protein [Parasulfuritortus cantonensis]
MKRVCVLLFALLAGLPVLAGDLYRWTDSHGQVHYSDQPPPAGAKTVKRLGASADTGTDTVRQPVVLFTANCGSACDQAADYMSQRNIPYTLKNVDGNAKLLAELKQRTGNNEVPVLFVGESMQRGFSPGIWDKMLEMGGYPAGAAQAPAGAPADQPPGPPQEQP